MNNTIKTVGIVIASVVLSIIAVVSFVKPTQKVVVGSGSGQDHYSYETFYAGGKVANFTDAGGITTISTTSTTYTLTQAELAAGNVISIANTVGATLSLTLPATSTLTTLIKTPGDSRTWYIQNLHTAAASTTTIVAGTGITLQAIAAGDSAINGAVQGMLRCYRKADTNVNCIVNEFVTAS